MKLSKTIFVLLLTGIWISCGLNSGFAAEAKGRKILFYRHPMNPSVSSPVAAKDEMGMDYIPVYEDEVSAGASDVKGHAGILVSPERQQMIGIKTAEAKEMPLVVKIRTLGRVGYDPDLLDSILEYRNALIAVRRLKGNPATLSQERSAQIVELAMKKLRLAGLSDPQIDGLARYGQLSDYFQLPPDAKWVYADIYEYESNLVRSGEKVKITAPSYPGKVFEGTVRSADEIYNVSSFIQRIRVEMKDSENTFKPGQSVDVEIQADLGSKLAVPQDAVLDSGEQKLVFVDKGEGHLEPREVQVGYETAAVATEADGYAEILSGLSAGEKVVSSATFLIDSESRLHAAAQSFVNAAKEKTTPEASHG